MQNHIVRAAVVAALVTAATTAANAANYVINASGASAQRTFWESDLEGLSTGSFGSTKDAAGNILCAVIATSAKLNPPVPDLHSLTCTVAATANRFPTTGLSDSGLVAGDTVTLNYGAEFGSVWGIAPFIPGSNANNTGRRTVTSSTVSGYSRDLDTATAGLSSPVAVDLGISDAEPIFWASQDNWPVADGLQAGPDGTGPNNVINILSVGPTGFPSLAQLQAVEASWVRVNGEVFTVVVDNTAAPGNAITNLSTESLRAIFTGKYATWAQVPEVGSGGNIVVCRRDHGSGTQVTSSLYFTGTECGGNNGTSYTGASTGTPTRFVSAGTSALGGNPGALVAPAPFEGLPYSANPIENFSSNDVKACLAAYPGVSIGILSLGSVGTNPYTILNVDNVQANAHNAANGAYKYAIATWVGSQAPTTNPASATLINTLITDAQKVNRTLLAPESGSLTNGVWTTTSPKVTYALSDFQNPPAPSVQNSSTTPAVPVTVWKDTAKSSCTIAR